VRKLSLEQGRDRLWQRAQPPIDPFQRIHRRPEAELPDLQRVPASPEEDILLFIRDHNPYLEEWARDVLTIVHEEASYFLPQIETKIMNEGWASYWHREILNSLELPPDLHLEFLVRHNQVVRPHPGGLNPYHIGLKLWDEIRRRHEDVPREEIRSGEAPTQSARDAMFAVREVDRDVSFLRRWLTEPIMRDLDLFQYESKGDDLVVTRVSNEDGWRDVKSTLLQNIGMGTTPVIRITDADFGGNRTLHLVHEHEGRDLLVEYAEKTLLHLHTLWGREVALETVINGKRMILGYGEQGFSSRAP